MKASVVYKRGVGFTQEFARAIGATTQGRFIHIPEGKGGGCLTGFAWPGELRMLVRHYYLREEVLLEWTSDEPGDADEVVFLLRGVFPPLPDQQKDILPEPPSVFICRHAASSGIEMLANTLFNSVTMAVARPYLHELFGELTHPLIAALLDPTRPFAFETGISPEMIQVASDLLRQPVPASLERRYFRLKAEELLCHTFALLLRQEAVPAGKLLLTDLKAVYAVKQRLLAALDQPPVLAELARDAGMSEPKLRKLFRQTFGKGVFAYYQAGRMQEAARLLRERRLTVSEVGYQLGFANLSHFSRVFEQHTGVKPKKYSLL